MAYNPNMYMPYGQQSYPQAAQTNWYNQQQLQQTVQQPTLQYQQPYDMRIKVKGRKGADAFAMPPNSFAILCDEDEDLLFFKATDAAGVADVKDVPFTIRSGAVQETGLEYATREDIERVMSNIDELTARVDALSKPSRTRKAANDGE